MKSLFEENTLNEVIDRISQLGPEVERIWGKMELAQMLSHCQNPLALAMGKQKLKKPNPIMRLIFKSFKTSMYNDKLWKPNLPTVKEYKVETEKDFETEKKKLLQLVRDFHEYKTKNHWEPHPSFGNFTHDQWGQMQYKHLDHHLRQFGV